MTIEIDPNLSKIGFRQESRFINYGINLAYTVSWRDKMKFMPMFGVQFYNNSVDWVENFTINQGNYLITQNFNQPAGKFIPALKCGLQIQYKLNPSWSLFFQPIYNFKYKKGFYTTSWEVQNKADFTTRKSISRLAGNGFGFGYGFSRVLFKK